MLKRLQQSVHYLDLYETSHRLSLEVVLGYCFYECPESCTSTFRTACVDGGRPSQIHDMSPALLGRIIEVGDGVHTSIIEFRGSKADIVRPTELVRVGMLADAATSGQNAV